MQLYQLEQFCMVARCEHMTQAAERLHVSQPALSQSISRLEEELGAVLFERRGRQIRLNNLGREFLTYVESGLRQLDDGRKILADMQQAANRRIRLADEICPLFCGEILREYMERHRDTAVEYMVCQGQNVWQMLQSAEVDLLLTTSLPKGKEYRWLPLGHLRLELFLPRICAGGAERIDLKDCRELRFVGADHTTMLRHVFESACGEAGFWPKFAYESNDWSRMAECAFHYQGALYYLNSKEHPLELFQNTGFPEGSMDKRVVSNPYTHPVWGVVTLKEHYLSPAVCSFLQFLQETFCGGEEGKKTEF